MFRIGIDDIKTSELLHFIAFSGAICYDFIDLFQISVIVGILTFISRKKKLGAGMLLNFLSLMLVLFQISPRQSL